MVLGSWPSWTDTYGCFVSACVHFRIREEYCNVMWFWWSTFIPKWATPNPLVKTCKLFFLQHAHRNSPVLASPERRTDHVEGPALRFKKKLHASSQLNQTKNKQGVKGKAGVFNKLKLLYCSHFNQQWSSRSSPGLLVVVPLINLNTLPSQSNIGSSQPDKTAVF